MEQITILVRDEGKAKSLLDLLHSLDFVSVVDVTDVEPVALESENGELHEGDFFAAAGIWEGREITGESLRAVAWPRVSK